MFNNNEIEVRFNEFIYGKNLRNICNAYPLVPAKKIEKSWWKIMKTHYDIFLSNTRKEFKSILPTMKYCPGIYDFINCGYTVPAWQDFEFFLEDNGNIKWRIPDTLDNAYIIKVHDESQHKGCPMSTGTKGLLKIATPWMIDTPEGYSTIFTKPFYDHPKGFDVCPGILDTDMDLLTNKQISIFIRIDVKNEVIRINAGQPLLQLIPFKRENFSYEICEPTEEFKTMVKRSYWGTASRFGNSLRVDGKDSLRTKRHQDNKNFEHEK